eukprot:g16732.t1
MPGFVPVVAQHDRDHGPGSATAEGSGSRTANNAKSSSSSSGAGFGLGVGLGAGGGASSSSSASATGDRGSYNKKDVGQTPVEHAHTTSSGKNDGGSCSTPPSQAQAARPTLLSRITQFFGSPGKSGRRGSYDDGGPFGRGLVNKQYTLEATRNLIQGRSYTLHDFELKQTVGTGTFGRVRVVRIKKSKLRMPFALKIMKKSEVINLRQVEHIRSERAILQTLQHPFIVNMFGTFQDAKRLFLILEYVNGGELFALLRKAGRLPPEHTRFYIGEIALAFK